jgi:hypothetical protein
MADNETTTDIIAWLRKPREGENVHLTLLRDEIADRLEAAIKRELAKIEADCAKLREAMLSIKADILKRRSENAWYVSDSDILEKIDAALAATPETETGKSSREDLLASALARVVEHAHGLDGDTIWTHAIRGEDYDFASLVLSETRKQ